MRVTCGGIVFGGVGGRELGKNSVERRDERIVSSGYLKGGRGRRGVRSRRG